MYYCCGVTDKGIMPHNEDALLINDSVMDSGSSEHNVSEPFIAAVSDGVSGSVQASLLQRCVLSLFVI